MNDEAEQLEPESEPNTEDAATQEAVDAAAREPLDSDDAPLIHAYDLPALADGASDLIISIDADESKSRYLYRMQDTASTMTHTATGTLLGADASGLRLYACMVSLESILRGRILERLCQKYGYHSKGSALASRRKLSITIATTEADLAEVGTILCNALEADALPFLKPSPARDAWQAVSLQLARFNIAWNVIAADAPGLVSLRVWAERVLKDCPHSGPVYSRAFKVAA